MTRPLNLGLVGYGKIAQDQHVPAIGADPAFALVAVATRSTSVAGVNNYTDIDAMLAQESTLDAVILCQPPQVRYDAARAAIMAGKHVFLEKPPGMTLSEVEALKVIADEKSVTIFASWHSRYAACVQAARGWIAARAPDRIAVVWREDVREWHPGQDWIWQPGGFGIFDPGINALSILTEIVGEPVRLLGAELDTPVNRSAPIAARLTMVTAGGTPIAADFDWRQSGSPRWDIDVWAGTERLSLRDGGNTLFVDGQECERSGDTEYPAMYRHFADLVEQRRSDVDSSPLRLVADAFLCGRHHEIVAFED